MAQTIAPSAESRTQLVERLGTILEKYKSLLPRGDYAEISSAYNVMLRNPDDRMFIQEVIFPLVESFSQFFLVAESYQARIDSGRALMEVVGVLEKIVDPKKTH